jgi:hypothetical protein
MTASSSTRLELEMALYQAVPVDMAPVSASVRAPATKLSPRRE